MQNIINSSAGFIDTMMVGSLGQDPVAALSIANTPFFIAMLVIFGLQSGGSVLISQYWGKRDISTINRVMGISWAFALSSSLLFATAMFFFPEKLMGLITNNAVLIDIAARYGKIVSFSQVLSAFVTIYIGARRSCESPRFGSYVMIASVLSNIVFNYIFIFGKLGAPVMGVEGAALGTALSRVVEVIITVSYILFGDRAKLLPIKIKFLLKPGKLIVKDFFRYSAPVMLNELLWSFGVSLYVVIYGHMAASGDIMAAFSLAGNIGRVITVVIFAVANTAAVFIGKEIGSGGTRREVFDLGRTFTVLAIISGLASGLLIIITLFSIIQPFVFPLIGLSESARRICTLMLLVDGIILVCRSFNTTIIVGLLRGGGDVNYSLFLDTGSIYLWAAPLAALCAFVFKLDILWVYIAVISEEPIKALFGFLRFKSANWISNVTRELN
jgi:putative MATE family efflux protein